MLLIVITLFSCYDSIVYDALRPVAVFKTLMAGNESDKLPDTLGKMWPEWTVIDVRCSVQEISKCTIAIVKPNLLIDPEV